MNTVICRFLDPRHEGDDVDGEWLLVSGEPSEDRSLTHACVFPKLLSCSKGEPDPTTGGPSTVSPRGVIPVAGITSRKQAPPAPPSLSLHLPPFSASPFFEIVALWGQISFNPCFYGVEEWKLCRVGRARPGGEHPPVALSR